MIDGISESEHIRINFMQVTIQCRLDPGKATGVREQIHFDIYFLDFRKNYSFRLFFVCIKKIVHYYVLATDSTNTKIQERQRNALSVDNLL